jgi:hypothetical protein
MDLDYISAKGPPGPLLLRFCGYISVNVGRTPLSNRNTLEDHMLIAHGQCQVQIENSFKNVLHEKFCAHFGVSLTVSPDPNKFLSCSPKRLCPQSLAAMLEAIECDECIITQYGMKSPLEHSPFLDFLAHMDGVSLVVDLAFEAPPTLTVPGYIPLCMPIPEKMAQYIGRPNFLVPQVHPVFVPMQRFFPHRKTIFGGYKISKMKNSVSAIHHVTTVHPKLAHVMKNAVETEPKNCPGTVAGLRAFTNYA